MSARPLLGAFLVALAACTTLSPRPTTANPWAHDPTVNLPVVKAPVGQCVDGILPDGKGGALLTVVEPCTLITSLPAHFPEEGIQLFHLRRADGVDPAWAANGVALPFTTTNGVSVASDSAGGAYLGWTDTRNLATTGRDVYLLHVRADGSTDPAYPASGLRLCGAAG